MRHLRAAIVAAMAVGALVVPTAAIAAVADTLHFDPGIACAFGLTVDMTGGNQVTRTFVDANGNPVRVLTAGRGPELTFTNTSTLATFRTRGNGSVLDTVTHPDGSQTVTLTGHNVLILFPSDIPAGPSTTLYVGRVVVNIDPSGTFTLVSTSGTATDICAALS
jgi:hypothetical protein